MDVISTLVHEIEETSVKDINQYQRQIEEYLALIFNSLYTGQVDLHAQEKEESLLGQLLKRLHQLVESEKQLTSEADETLNEIIEIRCKTKSREMKSKMREDYAQFLKIREERNKRIRQSNGASSQKKKVKKLKPIAELHDESFWGTAQQLRSGKVVSDFLGGLDPVFGVLLNVTDITAKPSVEAYQVKMAFFTPSALSEIIHRLVMNYFLMSKEELNNWEVDPEDFASEEVGESWKYQLRPSTEVLFLSLFSEFRSSVTPAVVNMIRTVQGCPESEDVNILLQKDAVYNAAGLASYQLFDEMDFNHWFSTQLVREMQNKSPGNKILRRRIAWLAGQWINVKFSSTNRPLLYQNLLHLMSDTEDLVVRLTAANTLRTSIDDVEFEIEPFLPYLEPSVSALFNLLHHVKECDTKMHVLHVMSLLIERVSEQIRPFAALFSVYLPQLWQESGDHNMLRCAILTTVTHLVQGLGYLSTNLYPFMLPIIQLSIDVTKPPHVYLLEDGLELWHKMVENAPSLTPDLLRLFHNMLVLLESSSENLRTCFNIIECYILLNEGEFLKTFGSSVASYCASMLGNIKPEGEIIVARTIETAIKVFPSECVQMFQPALVKIFQLILQEEDYPPLMAVYLSIFAQIILHNWTFFFGLVENMTSSSGKQGDDVFGSFLDIWLDKVDNMTKLERRKLTALALCSLLPLQSRCTSERFALILDVAVDVLHEVDRQEGEVHTDCLVVSPDDNPPDDSETEDYKRRRKLRSSDPVHCFPLSEYVRTKLTECRNVYGETQFQSLMERMDSAVAQQLFVFVSS